MKNALNKIVIFMLVIGAGGLNALEIVYAPNPVSFTQFKPGVQVRAAEVEVDNTSSGSFSSDNVWNVKSTSDSHFLHRIGFLQEFGDDAWLQIFRGDVKIDFNFEYFQTRLDYQFGYGFKPFQFLEIGPIGQLYYNYMGNSLEVLSTPDVTAQKGDKNNLYLIDDRSAPSTENRYRLVTLGPHLFGLAGGIFLKAKPVAFLALYLSYQIGIGETSLLSNGEINKSTGDATTTVPAVGYKAKISELEVKAYLILRALDIDFPTVILGYREQTYPSLGASEKGLQLGVATELD